MPGFLTVDWILRQFGRTRSEAQARYRAFVRAGVGNRPWEQLRGQIYLGDEEFVKRHAQAPAEFTEVPRAQRLGVRPPLEEIFRTEGSQSIALAYHEYGYRMKEMADFLGVHYATVSRRLRQLETSPKPRGQVLHSNMSPNGDSDV